MRILDPCSVALAVRRWGTTVRSLTPRSAAWTSTRKLGNGPAAFTAHGGRVRFAKATLDRWMAERADVDPMAPKKARGAA